LRKNGWPDTATLVVVSKSPIDLPRTVGQGEFACLTLASCLGALARNSRGSAKEKTMAERSQNLQDLFLNSVRKSKNPLTIFLINGVKLTGVVTSFDNFCVLLRRDGHSQLVYKHAISTIMPSQPVQMFDSEENSQGT
jgi:host factor-I protein